jgi:hypothetical protein
MTKTPPRRHRVRRIVLLVLALAMIYPAATYVRALTYPGAAPFAVRTTDWLRDDMGAGAVVNTVENWWYTRKEPPKGPPPAAVLPQQVLRTDPAGTRPGDIHVQHGLRGEGVWAPATGNGSLYTTFLRPDVRHGSVVAGAAWLNQRLVTTTFVAGTKEPGADPFRQAKVPTSLRPRLVADFNSGFKLVDAHGGAYLDGKMIAPLRAGAGSVVVHRDGAVTIDQWGRDARLSSDVVSVVQSLDLIVDHGNVVSGLDTNRDARWGSARSQYQYTWRSGLGTDKSGNLVYVAGDQLTLATLAAAMHDAGIVRGMQLDIHTDMVSFNYFGRPTSVPKKLLPTMSSPSYRYLGADLRAFFAITQRIDTTGGKP